MSPPEFEKAMAEVRRLHKEINRRADAEVEAAIAANGLPVPEDLEKARLVRQAEQILNALLEDFRAKRT